MWNELKSRTADEIKETIEALEKADTPPLLGILEQAVLKTNKEIWKQAQSNSNKSGMGTTLVASIVQDEFAFFAFVGDSRAYLISERMIQQISEDHSLVAQLVKSNAITAEEAKTHPYKNVIIRSLGSNTEIKPDLLCLAMQPDDIYLLCSDGLTNMITDDKILEIILSNPLKGACEKLIETANMNGGADNVSVILFKVVG
jgi:protein phosphatase